jgi:hypothetical protein
MSLVARFTAALLRRLTTGENTGYLEVDSDGSLFVKAPVRRHLAYTPDPGDIADGPCDAIMVDVDSDVTVEGAEDSAPVVIFLAARQWYPCQLKKVTAVTGGAQVVLGWCRYVAPLPMRSARAALPPTPRGLPHEIEPEKLTSPIPFEILGYPGLFYPDETLAFLLGLALVLWTHPAFDAAWAGMG